MALSDLTDPLAVVAAIHECNSLGREEFLGRHGFGEARSYFLEYNGRRYDSKAIAGVAHGKQHGQQLAAAEFSGGYKTVAAKLTELGFLVTRPAEGWDTPVGAITTKSKLTALYGGSIYGGIEPSVTSPNILIYTDPSAGLEHGYKFDEWDVNEPGVFYYSGEGQVGDQELTHGNKALMTHTEIGRTIRLFQAVDGQQRPGGKLHRYVGAFYLDHSDPYVFKIAPDREGTPRRVIVFRLIRDEVFGAPLIPVTPVEATTPAISSAMAVPQSTLAVCPACNMALPATRVCDNCD